MQNIRENLDIIFLHGVIIQLNILIWIWFFEADRLEILLLPSISAIYWYIGYIGYHTEHIHRGKPHSVNSATLYICIYPIMLLKRKLIK